MPIIASHLDEDRKALLKRFENALQEQIAKASSEANKKKPTPKSEAGRPASVVIRIESSGNHLVINQFFSSPESPDPTDQAPDRPVAVRRTNPPSHP